MNIKISKVEFKKLYDLACNGWKTKFDENFKNFIFSDELEFDRAFLDKMKSACDAKQLKVFNSVFEKHLISLTPFAGVKSYSDVCDQLGEDELSESDFKFLPKYMRKKALSQAKFQQIQSLSWGKDEINWKDTNQRKWYPYFTINSHGGLVFRDTFYYSSAFGGPVAFYKTENDAKLAGKLFLSLYEDLM